MTVAEATRQRAVHMHAHIYIREHVHCKLTKLDRRYYISARTTMDLSEAHDRRLDCEVNTTSLTIRAGRTHTPPTYNEGQLQAAYTD